MTTPNNNNPLKIGVAGACGRMGRSVIDAVRETPDMRVDLAFMPNGDSTIGSIIADDIPAVANETALATASIDVLIDFTTPQATLGFAEICAARKIGIVSGTTGFTEDETHKLQQAAVHTPILVAQNMSIGINVMYQLAAFAARQLNAGRLNGGYDMEVFEAHHRHKKDAPSGTALRLGKALAMATGGDLSMDAAFKRERRNEEDRKAETIGFSVVRGGDIVGEHRIIFAGAGEQIELTHRATSRANYAAGAIRAARFIASAKPAFYDGMESVVREQ